VRDNSVKWSLVQTVNVAVKFGSWTLIDFSDISITKEINLNGCGG
jgi:hypothetical protein